MMKKKVAAVETATADISMMVKRVAADAANLFSDLIKKPSVLPRQGLRFFKSIIYLKFKFA